jgi:homoserine/homoserine lactone efflux protein
MSFEGWSVFALFWVIFVTSPGPNAANCIQNGMTFGFARSLWGVAAILTQAALFLTLSALGVTALIAASPAAFLVAQLAGAALLIWLGLRNWLRAAQPIDPGVPSTHIYTRAFAIATINPKSVAGYLAAFSQFVMPGVPIAEQMWVIVPTALSITFLSYAGYTALGAWLGRRALTALANMVVRRVLAGCFILYGLALGLATPITEGTR